MANSYNGDDFESGLLTLSKDVFPTDDYLYQDGQYLDKDTLNSYLNPKYTKKEIDKMSEKEKESNKASENLGLNPSHKGEDDPEKSQNNLQLIYLIFLNKIFTIVGILKEKILKV